MKSGPEKYALIVICWILTSHCADAAELSKKTAEVFDHYVQLTETRIDQEISSGKAFLWPDSLPEDRRKTLYGQLRKGNVFTQRIETLEKGKRIDVPDGIIHHWLGLIFIPETTLEKTMKVVTDYDHHQDNYKPDVVQSKLLSHEDNHYKAYLRLYRKKVITVIFNTEHDIDYYQMDPMRIYSRSYATRIAEVENPGEKDERELPVGNDRGFLWRLDSYWRFQEKDGGVYAQCEALSLTRDIPAELNWLIGPLVNSIAKDSLLNTMNSTRTAVTKASEPATPAH